MYRLLPAILVISIFGCKEISFKEPQPRGIKSHSEMPRELRGTYLVIEESAGKDTVLVTKFGYYIPSDSSRGILGDSLIMKKYKGYYFFNEKSNSAWLLRVLKKEKNGDLSFMLIEPAEKSFDEFLLTLNEQIRIDSIDVSGGTLYQISPSPNKLVDLIERGFFKTSITLRKLR